MRAIGKVDESVVVGLAKNSKDRIRYHESDRFRAPAVDISHIDILDNLCDQSLWRKLRVIVLIDVVIRGPRLFLVPIAIRVIIITVDLFGSSNDCFDLGIKCDGEYQRQVGSTLHRELAVRPTQE